MKIIDKIVSNFIGENYDYDVIEQSENLSKFLLIIDTKEYFIPEFKNLKNIILKIPDRDTVELAINETNLSCSEFNEHDYSTFIQNLNIYNLARDTDENNTFKIEIYKNQQNNNISIYCIETFTKYLNESSLEGILFSFKKYMDSKCLFLRLQNDDFIAYTNSIYFLKENEDVSTRSYDKYNKIKKRNMTCSFLNASKYEFSPEDFYLIERSIYKILNDIFDKLCIVFSLIYISDISNIDDKDYLKCTLKGYRLIENKINFNDIDTSSQNQYYSIYKWIYSEDNIEDKIGISRNVISLDIKNNDLLKISKNLFNSIKSAHSIYLKENVEKYIEVKNKVTEFLFDMSQRSSELVEGLGKSFKNNMVAVITYFFTIIIMNSLSSGRLDNIFTRDIIIISFSFLFLSFLYMFFSLKEVKEEKRRFRKLYNRLKTSYKDILNENDINYIFKNDQYIEEDLDFIGKKIRIYKKLWISCLLIILFLVIIG